MKILKVETDKDCEDIYNVYFKPNWFERLTGVIGIMKKYKDSSRAYEFRGQGEYIKQDGSYLENFNSIAKAIDNHRRKFD